MSTPPAPARVFGFVAAEADVAVLLRREPSRQVLMVRWDLATDEFEIGQWLRARVYENRADLSPNGRLFVYQALNPRWGTERGGAYSVVCRPPYFTALAFWDQGTNDPSLRWRRLALAWKVSEPTKGTLPRRYEGALEKGGRELRDGRGEERTVHSSARPRSAFSNGTGGRTALVGVTDSQENRSTRSGPTSIAKHAFCSPGRVVSTRATKMPSAR